MFLLNWISLILFFVILFKGHVAEVLDTNFDNYGPYHLEIARCEMCAGSKSKNLTHYTLEMTKNGDDFIAKVNFTFWEPSHFDEIKITIYNLKEHQKTMLFNYKINDPCKHFSIASIIEKFLNARKCTVPKGKHNLIANLSEISKAFFGSSFFYGNFLIKSNVMSKQGNIFCVITNSVFTKKT